MDMDQQFELKAARAAEWKQHWGLVLAATVSFGMYALIPNSIGLFLQPIADDFSWTRTTIMSGMILVSMSGIFLSPLVGAAVDKYGSRRIGLPGLVAMALAFSALSLADGSTAQWILLWSFLAVAVLLVKATVWTTAVSAAFDASRSLAIGVTMSGAALGQAIVPPLTQWLIADFGWRQAFVGLGMGWGVISFVLSFFFLRDPHLKREHSRDNHSNDEIVKPTYDNIPGLTLAEAIKDKSLILIGVSTFIVMLVGVGISVNQVPIMTAAGVSRETAAYLASLFGVCGVIGKLSTGWLMDRFKASTIGSITLFVSAFSFLLLLDSLNNIICIVIGMMVLGYAAGTKLQICAYLTSRYAGMRNYGKVFGVMSSLIAVSGGLGPVMAGATFDYTGSYSGFIYCAMVATIFASYLLFRLGPPPEEFAGAFRKTRSKPSA